MQNSTKIWLWRVTELWWTDGRTDGRTDIRTSRAAPSQLKIIYSIIHPSTYLSETTTTTSPLTTASSPYSNIAILITGGLSADTKAEIYIPATNRSCQLPDLPVRRYFHTQDGFLTCGGTIEPLLCHTWNPETGTWPESYNLTTGRSMLSWTPRSGNGTYLIGGYWKGWDHAKTTTLVKPDGSVVPGFNVNDYTE